MPSVVSAVNTYVSSFPTKSIPAAAATDAATTLQLTRLGVRYASTSGGARRRHYGCVPAKSKALPQRALVSPAQLLESIKTQYAHLLTETADGTHYVIDMSALAGLEMRKRYRSLACTLRLTKDLSSVEVQPADTTTPTGTLAHLGQVALAVWTLLKEAVVKIWGAVAPAFSVAVSTAVHAVQAAAPALEAQVLHTLSAEVPQLAPVLAVAEPALQAASAAALQDAGAAVIQAVDDAAAAAQLTTTQKTLAPFQSGLGAFLSKVDTYVLEKAGLLYQLTGATYQSLLAWLKAQLGALTHTLPTERTGAVAELPVIQLGKEYFQHFETYIADSLKKGQLVLSEVEAVVANLYLPAAWSAVQKLAYTLWSLTFGNTLVLTSVQDTFSKVGSVLTLAGQSAFAGLQQVVEALKALFSFKGTSLVAASDVLATPALARKFISLKELVETEPKYAELQALAPHRVALALV